jgi:predicted AlkP superfamily pyrophosphatase or phosphodiesterase
VLSLALVVVVTAAAAAWRLTAGDDRTEPTLDEMAAGLGSEVMRAVYLGHVPGRSGEIVLVPKPHRFVLTSADQCGLVGGRPGVATTHAGPWSYLAQVPLVFYGPGIVPEGQTVTDPVDLAAVAPTLARIVGAEGFVADAEPLAAVTGGERPALVVGLVLDGGGWNVLRQHPTAWPTIRRLIDQGTLYVNATNGSSPSITGAVMATIGTGRYPAAHGIPGNQMRGPDGDRVDTWSDDADPSFLEAPTAGDVYDAQTGNRSIQAVVGEEGWHVGLLGAGTSAEGGDADIAALWSRAEDRWWTNEEFYSLPDYLADLDAARLAELEAALDPQDGLADGRWFDDTIATLGDEEHRPATPALAAMSFEAARRILDREGMGQDDVTDVLWLELVAPDQAGHVWGSGSPQVAEAIAEIDRQLGALVEHLDATVGPGRYVVAVTADHGQEPLPESTGGWRINAAELTRDLEAEFGPVVEKVTAGEVYLDPGSDADAGAIARFLGAYTIADNTPEDRQDRPPASRADETLFAGIFPSTYLQGLSLEGIAALGHSAYPEGHLELVGAPTDG